MSNSVTHSSLPYPIRKARFTIEVPYVAATGVPTDPTTPDTEASIDGAAFADCTEEVTTITGSNGFGYMTLTGAEMDCTMLVLAAKVASGPNNTLMVVKPRTLALIGSGTLSAGSAGGGTLGTLLPYDVTGCFIRTTGGTGGGGTGGANNQARKIATYNTATGAFTIVPNWETTVSTDTTYDMLLPEGVTLGMLRTDYDVVATLGALSVAASSGDPGSATTLIAYIKQLINTLEGTAGIPAFPAAAVSGNAVSFAEVLRSIDSRLPAALTANGNLKASLLEILTTLLTETSGGLLTGGFKKLFDVASPVLTLASVNQGGDNFTRIGAPVTSVSADIAALLVAIQNVQNNTFIATSIPGLLERPDSSSTSVSISIVFCDETGTAKNLDSGNPTISLLNDAGTSLASRLGSISNPSTGKYVVVYTNTSTDAVEGMHWDITGTVNSKARRMVAYTQIVDTTAVNFTSTDRTMLNLISTNAAAAVKAVDPLNPLRVSSTGAAMIDWGNIDQPSSVVNLPNTTFGTVTTYAGNTPQTGDVFARVGALGAGLTALASASSLSTLTSNLAALAAKFTGMTLVARWFGLLAGKTADASTLAEMQATPAGTGYLNSTDSQEALRDRGDAAWVTGGGGGGGGGDATLANQVIIINYMASLVSAAVPVHLVLPFDSDEVLNIVRGDDYFAADGTGRSINLSSDSWPDLTGATVKFTLTYLATGVKAIDATSATVITPTGSIKTVGVDLTTAQTSSLSLGDANYGWDFQATLSPSGHKVTLASGVANILRDYTT